MVSVVEIWVSGFGDVRSLLYDFSISTAGVSQKEKGAFVNRSNEPASTAGSSSEEINTLSHLFPLNLLLISLQTRLRLQYTIAISYIQPKLQTGICFPAVGVEVSVPSALKLVERLVLERIFHLGIG
jgi:hypothetical protein